MTTRTMFLSGVTVILISCLLFTGNTPGQAQGRPTVTPLPTLTEPPAPTSTREFSACAGYVLIDFSVIYPDGIGVEEEGRINSGILSLTDQASRRPSDRLVYRLNLRRTLMIAEASFFFEVESADISEALLPLFKGRGRNIEEINITWFGTPCDFQSSQAAAVQYLAENASEWELSLK